MKDSTWLLRALVFGGAFLALTAPACSAANSKSLAAGAGGATSSMSASTDASSADVNVAAPASNSASSGLLLDAGGCDSACAVDGRAIVDCHGGVLKQCASAQICDPAKLDCADACQVAIDEKRSVGCEYYATYMDQVIPGSCFAVFVANTWSAPVHIGVEYKGSALQVDSFARLTSGSGPSLGYSLYDAAGGLAPGEVAILFLSGDSGTASNGLALCPIPAAVPSGVMSNTTNIGNSFHITTDAPVVAYEINPYGGGSAAVTAASLLLPTSVWDTNYIAVNVAPFDPVTIPANPSLNIVAKEDATTVTIVPVSAVIGGGGIPAGAANQPLSFQLAKGENAQISQQDELTGSVISSDKPVGLMAGHGCMHWPQGVSYCDHGEQMIPPIKALGHEYVGVMYRPRPQETETGWRLIGAVDGTVLTFTPPIAGAPASLDQGQAVELTTGTPFVVSSQDKDHPFMLFTYMSGSAWVEPSYGDPDFVISVPPEQYLNDYVFFADPTYPETNLVLVRAKGNDLAFHDVNLDCAGVLKGWQAVGGYEWTRVDLISHDFVGQNGCSTGRHRAKSDAPFGLWVWGWGTPETSTFTGNVSYGYPGGMSVTPINVVVVPPTPK